MIEENWRDFFLKKREIKTFNAHKIFLSRAIQTAALIDFFFAHNEYECGFFNRRKFHSCRIKMILRVFHFRNFEYSLIPSDFKNVFKNHECTALFH